MPLKNYVDLVGPVVLADWLNQVDILKFTVFADAATKLAARAALTSDASFAVSTSATGGAQLTQVGYNTYFDSLPQSNFNGKLETAEPFKRSAAEIAAGVTPSDFQVPSDEASGQVNLLRYYSGSGAYDSAMTAAIAVCSTTGGTIILPRGSLTFASPISLAGKSNITLQGQGGLSAGAATGTAIDYTGAADEFIDLDGAFGCWIKDLQITYSNTGFNGKAMLRLGSSSFDSFQCGVERCILGASTGTGCIHIALDGAICFIARDCHFIFGNSSITGAESAGINYSNVIKFENCVWSRCRATPVLYGGEAWTFIGCTFEQLETTNAPGAFASVGQTSKGMTFQGCWFGDSTATGIWIQYQGTGLSITGNHFSTVSGANTVAIALTATDGASITANHFVNFTNALDFAGAGNSAIQFAYNFFNNVTVPVVNVANVAADKFVFNPNDPLIGSLTGVATIAADGFSYDNNGILTVWASSSVTVGTPLVVTYAKAFASAPRITLGVIAPPGTNNTADITAISNTQFTLNLRGTAGSGVVHWHAIGV